MKLNKFLITISAVLLFSLTFLVPSYNSVKDYLTDEFDSYTCDVFPNPIVSVKLENFERADVKVKLRLYYTRNGVPTFVENKTIYNYPQDYNPRCGFLNPSFNNKEVIHDLSTKNTSNALNNDQFDSEVLPPLPSVEDILFGPQHTFYTDNHGNKVDCNKKVCFYSSVYETTFSSVDENSFSYVHLINYKKLFTLITFLIFIFSILIFYYRKYNHDK